MDGIGREGPWDCVPQLGNKKSEEADMQASDSISERQSRSRDAKDAADGASALDVLYVDYLASDDKTLIVDGNVFHKIIFKDTLHIPDCARMITSVIVSKHIGGGKTGDWYEDERGNRFECRGREMMSFRGREIPEWYLETLSLCFEDVESFSIGSFLRCVEGEEHVPIPPTPK